MITIRKLVQGELSATNTDLKRHTMGKKPVIAQDSFDSSKEMCNLSIMCLNHYYRTIQVKKLKLKIMRTENYQKQHKIL